MLTDALKTCAVVLTAASMLYARTVNVKADAVTELEAAKRSMEITFMTDMYGACVEEERIAKQYLGSVQTLAGYNPLYESGLKAAQERAKEAEKSREKAGELLQIALGSEAAWDNVTVPAGHKQLVGITDNKNGSLLETFTAWTTGSPTDPHAELIVEDFPKTYLNYGGYHVIARYYTGEKLKVSTEESESAGKATGSIIVDGEMPEGGYADQVAVEAFVGDGRSIVFLWDDDGSLRITDKE